MMLGKVVAETGFEPVTADYETAEMPVSLPRAKRNGYYFLLLVADFTSGGAGACGLGSHARVLTFRSSVPLHFPAMAVNADCIFCSASFFPVASQAWTRLSCWK